MRLPFKRGAPERVVGLDIGTTGVRAVEVELFPTLVVRAMGSVGLPPGAVAAGGEVADPGLVAEAVRELWRQAGIRPTRVRVGVGSPRVVVRTIELPAMPDAEIDGLLRLQGQEYVPLPVEEAILDWERLESFPAADQAPMIRILLAAAHREAVAPLLAAVEAAGLEVSAVDVIPLALVRSLGSTSPGGPSGAEAIVSVGAGVMSVVVHEAGTARFVRIVASDGGPGDVPRHLPLPAAEMDDGIAAAADRRLDRIVRDVTSSLDYYLSQPGAAPLTAAAVTGGGAHTSGLVDGIGASLGRPVRLARPQAGVQIPDEVAGTADPAALDTWLPVALGLALGAAPADGRKISLLPAEAQQKMTARRTLRRVLAGTAAAAVALGGISATRLLAVAREQDRLADQERRNQAVTAMIGELTEARELDQQLGLARQLVSAAAGGGTIDISWARVLQDLGGGMPENVWLTALKAQVSSPAPAAAASSPGGAGVPGAAAQGGGTPGALGGAPGALGPAGVGTLTFTAVGLDFPSVAAWLQEVPRIPYYGGVSVSSAAKGQLGPTQIVNFASSATLTRAAASDRLARLVEAGG